MIDRIEILKDGAPDVAGTDADRWQAERHPQERLQRFLETGAGGPDRECRLSHQAIFTSSAARLARATADRRGRALREHAEDDPSSSPLLTPGDRSTPLGCLATSAVYPHVSGPRLYDELAGSTLIAIGFFRLQRRVSPLALSIKQLEQPVSPYLQVSGRHLSARRDRDERVGVRFG